MGGGGGYVPLQVPLNSVYIFKNTKNDFKVSSALEANDDSSQSSGVELICLNPVSPDLA